MENIGLRYCYPLLLVSRDLYKIWQTTVLFSLLEWKLYLGTRSANIFHFPLFYESVLPLPLFLLLYLS